MWILYDCIFLKHDTILDAGRIYMKSSINYDNGYISPRILLRWLSIITVFLLLLAYSIILLSPPATGYELNIYSMYSHFFWLLVCLIAVISVAIITLSEYWKLQGYWKVALFSMLGLELLILLLPSIRGYYMLNRGTGDVFAHLAWTQYILNMGTMTTYYPGSHILLASFQIAGINIDTVSLALGALFPILYVLFLYMLGKSFQKSHWVSLLPILFAFPMLFQDRQFQFQPYMFAIFFMPLFFYLLLRSANCGKKTFYSGLIIILSFMIVYFHPLIILYLIIFTLGILITSVLFSNSDVNLTLWKSHLTYLTLILTVSFSTWYLSFSGILRSFGKVFSAIFESSDTETLAGRNADMLASEITGGIDPFYVIKLFILNYGSIGLYLFVGMLCTLLVINTIRMKKNSGIELYVSVIYLMALFIGFSFLVKDFILGSIIRAFSPAIVMSMILIPLVLSDLLSKLPSKGEYKYYLSFISLGLVIVIIISLFTVYPSPIVSLPSQHMTSMEKTGLDFFIQYRDDAYPVLLGENVLGYKKYEMFYSERYYDMNNDAKASIDYLSILPTHYGYRTYTTLSEMLDSGGYSREYYHLSTELNRQTHYAVPEERRELLPTYTYEDTERLKRDPSINLLYSNSEFEAWIISRSEGNS